MPPFHVVAGCPARIIRKIKTNMDPEQRAEAEAEREKEAKDKEGQDGR